MPNRIILCRRRALYIFAGHYIYEWRVMPDIMGFTKRSNGRIDGIRQVELWNKYLNHLLNEGRTQKRIEKLEQMFKTCERGLNGVDYADATREDIEDFIARVHRDDFRRTNGAAYTGSSKADFKRFLKQFYKWLEGEGEEYPRKVRWIRTAIAKDEKPQEKPVLSREEALLMAKTALKPEHKAMILLLFDSGFRIHELLSATKRDFTLEPFRSKELCYWIKCNESKTIPRKVPCPLFTEELAEFEQSSYFQSLKPDDLIYPKTYNSYLYIVMRTGLKALGRDDITPHLFRHSSATLYSEEILDGDIIAIANRYGWSYDARELKTYVRRSKRSMRKAAERVSDNDVLRLKQEQERLKEREARLHTEIGELKETVADLARSISLLTSR